MRIITYLFYIMTVLTTTRTILALPRAVFVDESHNDRSSTRNGSLNATVSLARAFGALTRHEITSKRHNGAVFPNPKAAAPVNVSYPMTSSAPVQQNPQWSPDGISTVVFGCIASILGVLAIWATFWLGHRQFGSRRPDADHSDEVRLQELPTNQPSDIATPGSNENRQ